MANFDRRIFMRKMRSYMIGLICCTLLLPAHVTAQEQKEDAEDFVNDVLKAILGPNWNLFAHTGVASNGRFLLQRVSVAGLATGERTLRGDGGFSVGLGAGVDILLRQGVRLDYTYSSSDLNFREDNGDGSRLLDLDGVGKLQSHMASIELIRYRLPARAAITPYGTAGLTGTWWVMDSDALMNVAGGSTQFRFGALGSIGLQVKLSDRMNVRMEAASASVHNPFTGPESYRALNGTTIDEPTRVTKSDFRIAAVYNFGKPDVNLQRTSRSGAKR
jgi:opacity protein-like surface antigen